MRTLSAARVASRWLSAGNSCFDGATSFAWVDPQGRLHETGLHEGWAEHHILTHDRSRYQEILDIRADDDHPFTRHPATLLLLRDGWIRLANAFVFQVYDASDVSDRAWHAALEPLIDCMLKRRRDPEQTIAYLGEFISERPWSVADLVQRYGTKEQSERLYSGLVA